jgi:hypothetical protein
MIKRKINLGKIKENEVLISSDKSSFFELYFNRAYDLLIEKNYNHIYIKGLGATSKSAINISLIILDKISNLKIKNIETSTISISENIINTFDNYNEYNYDNNSHVSN